ncbi:MAG TPA: hypothetical protein ACFYD6_00505 [Candidatus Brocadiia bacterium]|nr:hypothetical protein [Candidatus Brocadiales bacterium]
MSENTIKLKLTQIVNRDREGKEVKDNNGIRSCVRDDNLALYQLCEAINSKVLTVRERAIAVSLADKSREAFLTFKEEVELNTEEAALLKKLLENEENKDIVYPMFFIRTMVGLLEQLK